MPYAVEGHAIKRRCTKAAALALATRSSEPDNMNEGYPMITDNVLNPRNDAFKCTLMPFCNASASADYQLKPDRAQATQTAFAAMPDVLEEEGAEEPPVLLAESLDHIPDFKAESASEHLHRLIRVACRTAKLQGTARQQEWTEQASPTDAGKCRRHDDSSTDDLLGSIRL